MYRVPEDIDLSKTKGQCTTQLAVGPFDLQFEIGDVHFAVQSEVRLMKNDKELTRWQSGEWPDGCFYDLLNVNATSVVSRSKSKWNTELD